MPQVDKQILGIFPFPLPPPPTPDICKYHRGTYVIPTKSEKYKHTLKVGKKSGNQKSVSHLRAFPALFLKKERVHINNLRRAYVREIDPIDNHRLRGISPTERPWEIRKREITSRDSMTNASSAEGGFLPGKKKKPNKDCFSLQQHKLTFFVRKSPPLHTKGQGEALFYFCFVGGGDKGENKKRGEIEVGGQ